FLMMTVLETTPLKEELIMTTPTFADVTRALARHSERTSKAEANRVLESVTGTTSLRDIDPTCYAEAIAALDGGSAPGGSGAAEIDSVKIYAHWNSFRRAPRDGADRE